MTLERAITDVLLHPRTACLLVSTPTAEVILSTNGRQINRVEQPPGFTRIWCQHPGDPSKLIAATGKHIEIYYWEKLMQAEKKVNPICILATSTPDVFYIQGIAEKPSFRHLAIQYTDPSATRPRNRIMIFDALMLEEAPEASTKRGVLETRHQSQLAALERVIEHVFGHIGTRIVFLDRNGWICSADLDVYTEESYLRHFFIPSDWLSINPDYTGIMTQHNDLAFVQRNEVAVIKRGFDYSEQVPLTADGGEDVRF